MSPAIYLDYNATTPVDERVFAKMAPYFTRKFGNPASRDHAFGWDAFEAVEEARVQAAELINARPAEIIFTSGATESINLALKGLAQRYRDKGNHLLTSAVEHPAVLETCRQLQREGFAVTYLPVDGEGNLDLQQLEESITDKTILVAIMAANNEIGTICPIAEIGAIARKREVFFFTDAAQAAGKIPLDVEQSRIDLAALSAHKLYGPKGVGALYVRGHDSKVELTAQMHGGGQERGMRSGTLNVPGIVGFGEACRLAKAEMPRETASISCLRDRLETAVLSRLPNVCVNGSRKSRLPNVTNLAFEKVASRDLIRALPSIAISTGSACSSAITGASHVLEALGFSHERVYSSLRFSLGRFTTAAEIDCAAALLEEQVKRLRERG